MELLFHPPPRQTARPPYRLYGVISLIKMSSARYILATNFPLESETGAGRRARVGLAGILAASSSSWGDRENRSISVPIKSRRTSKKETNKSPLMIFFSRHITACVRDNIFLLERRIPVLALGPFADRLWTSATKDREINIADGGDVRGDRAQRGRDRQWQCQQKPHQNGADCKQRKQR